MTKDETITIITMIKIAYPYVWKDFGKKEAELVVEMWAEAFSKVPFALVKIALKDYIRHNKFAPTIAEMIEGVEKLYWVAVGKMTNVFSDRLPENERAFYRNVIRYFSDKAIKIQIADNGQKPKETQGV